MDVAYKSEVDHPFEERDLILYEFISFQFKGEDELVIKKRGIDYQFLNKLCGNTCYILS